MPKLKERKSRNVISDANDKWLLPTALRSLGNIRCRTMRASRKINGAFVGILLLALSSGFLTGCGIFHHDIPRFGIGGLYNEGKEQFLKGRGGNMDTAVAALDSVVRDDPTYKDSLTLLGRAYYNKGNYEVARQILQRALLVKKDDEIAWTALGLAQLQLGEDEKGIETLQGAITLISKVSRGGYRGFPQWDGKGLVRTYISRSVVEVRKGPEGKASLIRTCETLLARMDDEENYQSVLTMQQRHGEG
jgi:tetratricopeptide (TPR) repeat protein